MRIFLFLILAVALQFSWCAPSYARLSGSLEWGYGQYQADEGGVRVNDSSYFAQKYQLMLSQKGTIMGGRGGRYNLSLGGEWWGLNNDNTINGIDNDINISNGKLLYLGELIFAPGGLPVRFNMYGRDMSGSHFIEDRYFTQGTFDELSLTPNRPSVLTPNIVNDVTDGTRHEYGASFVFGIKNGSYLGRYRDLLSHLPKLYVDYRETRTKDLKSLSPEDSRERELAFVSLNKKHNWFHYRYYEYLDYLFPVNNFGETTYLLGTVDQNLRREWINLTNWIQLSTDGRYTQWDNQSRNQGIENDYSVNLFLTTERLNWRSSLLSTYSRFERVNQLDRRLFVPFSASGEPDRNNAWRFRMIGNRELLNNPFALVNTENAKDNVYTSLRWETNIATRFVSAPVLEVEGKFGDRGQGSAVRASYEYYTNKKVSRSTPYDLFSRLGVAYFNGSPQDSFSVNPYRDINLLELTGKLDIAKQLNSRVRTGVGSLLLLGTGEAEASVTDYIRPLSLERLRASLNMKNPNIDGTVWRIEAFWFVEHVSLSRITNRLETGVEYQDFQTDSYGQYYLEHRLGYSARAHSVNIESEFLYGDSLYRSLTSRVFNTSLASQEYDGVSFTNHSSYSYSPNRSHQLGGNVKFDWRHPDQGNDGNRIALSQEYRYTQYLQRGVVRRLLELNEYLDYERMDPDGTQVYEALALSGLVNYYPTSWTRLACKVKWQNDIRLGTSDTGFGLYTDFNFSLLNVGLEYEYGMRTADNSGAILDRDEQRWSVSVRKVF